MDECYIVTIVVQGTEKKFLFTDFKRAKTLFDSLNNMAINPSIPCVYIDDVDGNSFFLVTRQGLGFVSLIKEWR